MSPPSCVNYLWSNRSCMIQPTYSFIIPVYNEAETLPELRTRICEIMDRMDGSAEVVLINDGSRDRSYETMLEINRQDPRFKIIHFARNFGHQMAISAGMDLASGQAVIIMDADLQDPPEVVLEMAQRWRQGYEVVYGVREEREGETWFKRVTAAGFYRILRHVTDLDIPADVGDFRLVDRKALDAFRALREKHRYVRGMFTWIGFKQIGVHYKRSARFAGNTKYPLKKMLKLAMDGVVSFSMAPLRMALNVGFVLAGVAFLGGVTSIIAKFAGAFVVPGWVSLMVVESFMGGLILVVLGVMGEYVGRIYEEVKDRPLYLVRDLIGFSPEVVPASRTYVHQLDRPASRGALPARARVRRRPARNCRVGKIRTNKRGGWL